jgi:hypothetical protein
MYSSDKLPHLAKSIRNDPDLPDQGTSEKDEDLPWGWSSTKPEFAVSFEWPDGLKRSFRYTHLESDMTLRGDTLTMRFSGLRSFLVTIEGRNLARLYYLLQRDRMRAVRQAVRDFDAQDGEPFIKAIVAQEEKADLD